ncbi:MAG: allantoinase AllB [Oscillospiraceae bacterium]|nr:allantoinase AllB [Oscillospiraceae bacterium]
MVIINGKVSLPDQVMETQIGVKNEKFAGIGFDLAEGNCTVDAKGMFVLPGVVDAHVHLCEPGRTEWEGFVTGTKAMAAGGVTCYVDMPLNNLPATIDRETILIKLAHANGKNYVDYALYGGVVPHNLGRLYELDREGVAAYKCFMSTCGFGVPGDFKNIDDFELYKAMLELKELGQTLSIHCENAVICDGLALEAQDGGRTGVDAYVDSRPIFAEVEAVKRALYLGKVTECKLHFVHLSCAESVHEVYNARREGMDVTIESCPHYLNLNRDIFAKKLGAMGKCAPPLRDSADTEKMWDALISGQIDILASDHSPCPLGMKDPPDGDIFKAWGGLSSCQNTLDIMFDEGVQKRGMCVTKLMKVMASNPAGIFGMKNKGEIALGKDADIVLLEPDSSYILKSEDLYYRHRFSPYVGKEIGCRVMKTFVRGHLVYDRSIGIIGAPIGQYIKKSNQVMRL